MKLRIAVVAGALAIAGVSVRAETIDRVMAVVGGQLITLSDVTVARDLGLVASIGAPDPVRAVLSQLIDRELMLAEVDRYAPPEPSADVVDRDLAAVKSRFSSAADYDAVLTRSGIDDRRVREFVRQTLRIRAYQDQRFSSTDTRRDTLIGEWLSGLRRRGDVVDIYAAGRP